MYAHCPADLYNNASLRMPLVETAVSSEATEKERKKEQTSFFKLNERERKRKKAKKDTSKIYKRARAL